jgi:hypothetical protein
MLVPPASLPPRSREISLSCRLINTRALLAHARLRTRLGDGGDGVTDTAGTTESRAALMVAAIGWSSSAVPRPKLTRGRRRARSWPCRTRTVNTLWTQALPRYAIASA